MARPLRIEYPGATYHVTSRGNERKKIFRDNSDRKRFLEILAISQEIYNVETFSYVLMDNHFLCEASHNYLLHITFSHFVKNSVR